MDLNDIRELFEYTAWADATLWTAIAGATDAMRDENIRVKMNHIHVVQRVFLSAWRNEAIEGGFPEFSDASEVRAWGQAVHAALGEYIGGLDGDSLCHAMPVPWATRMEKRFGRKPDGTTIGQTMLQVVMHSTYHRGQVNVRLRELGAEPPLLDYIAWIWLGKPSPEWRA